MNWIDRVYEQTIHRHFADERQMLFLMGPRQVGKTATAKMIGKGRDDWHYLNWDNVNDRRAILAGPAAMVEALRLEEAGQAKPLLVLDELHKYEKWKDLLKGLFDVHGESLSILVTGSARLDVFRYGGDSLLGRYFAHRLHPLSLAELTNPAETEGPEPWMAPKKPADSDYERLMSFGGFPEVFVRAERRFHRKWRRQRTKRLFSEDLRDLTNIRGLGQVEVMAELLRQRVGQLVSYTTFANELGCSIETARRWLQTLESLYYCFSVRPWWKNVARALRKEPKYYLWDWSAVDDRGSRFENFVASALLKAAHAWTDRGDGDFGLHFIRDKQGHEVDFLVSRDSSPWLLVEVKRGGAKRLSKALLRFHDQLAVPHTVQVVSDMDYRAIDCFALDRPAIVPARSFLAQLV